MKNIVLMNIIYNQQYEAEAEYIKEFFSYIGFIVNDISLFRDYDFSNGAVIEKMKKPNTINIILNYYGPSISYTEIPTIYMYFDIEQRIIDIKTTPHIANPFRIIHEENGTFIIGGSKIPFIDANKTKGTIRTEALSMLMNEIWKNDYKTRLSIQQIMKHYVPQNSFRDFFYTIQTVKCIKLIFCSEYLKNNVIPNTEINNFNLNLDSYYLFHTFDELARMYNSLSCDSLYSVYAKLKTAVTILKIYNVLDHNSKYFFEGSCFDINLNELQSFIVPALEHLKTNNFISAYLFTKQDAISFLKSEQLRDYPIPFYKVMFDVVFNLWYDDFKRNGIHNENDPYQKELNRLHSLIIGNCASNNSISSSINFALYNFLAFDKFKKSLSILRKATNQIGYNKNFDDLFSAFLAENLEMKIDIRGNWDYPAQLSVQRAYSTLTKFENADNIRKLAGEDEYAFIEFMKFHCNSKYLYVLYKVIEQWTDGVVNTPNENKLVKQKLLYFGDRYKKD